MATKGEKQEGINKELGINRYTLLYAKQINSKVLLYSIEDYIQYLVRIYGGKESQKEYMYVYIHINCFLSPYLYICCTMVHT